MSTRPRSRTPFRSKYIRGSSGGSAKLYVDDDLYECPDALYTSIQDAVNASDPGETVIVCPGVYDEQVTILHDLRIEGQNAAIIRPSTVTANSTTVSGLTDVAAIILVEDANVNIKNVTVDGSGNDQPSCRPFFTGIFYRNASGNVWDAAIRNIRLGPGLEGCQSGVGVFVQSGDGEYAQLSLRESSIHDYQKGGVVANEPATYLDARSNVVTGDGATPFIAQNGIQVGFGATGIVEDNVVANHVYAECTPSYCDYISIGILFEQSSQNRAKRNTVTRSQVGIYAAGDANLLVHNHVSDNVVFDGIDLEGDNNRAVNNTIVNSDDSAIFIAGSGNLAAKNSINEALTGIWVYYGDDNELILNTFRNTEYTIYPPLVDGADGQRSSRVARPRPEALRP